MRALQVFSTMVGTRFAGGLTIVALLAVWQSVPCLGKENTDFAKACALRVEGKTEKALESFKRVLASSPGHQGALLQVGACLEDLGRWKDAEKTYLRLLKINPDNKSAKRNLGHLRAALGVSKPGPVRNRSKEIILRRGLEALEQKKPKTALALFRVVQGLNPYDPRPLFYSALACEQQGDRKKAIDMYKRTIVRFPDFAPARVNLILALMNSGDRVAATDQAREGLERLPKNKQIDYLANLVGVRVKTSSR